MKITVLGSGGWGSALAILLAKKGYEVTMWSFFSQEIDQLKKTRENPLLPGVRLDDRIALTPQLDQAVKDADMLVLAVPSHAIRSTCSQLKQFGTMPLIVSVAKGFDENGCRLSEVIMEELKTDQVAVLSGPTHAEEVARGVPTAIVAASRTPDVAQKVQDVFMCETMRVYTNEDVIGVEVSGALKNVIALCAGISDGSGFGDNTKAALMTRGMTEIARLGIAMGGKMETFAGLTGIGDLIVTCTSMHSRNRRAGILIGQGKTVDEAVEEVKMVVEGVKSCNIAYELAKRYQIEMPIVNTAYEVLYHHKSPKEAVAGLMMRDKKPE